MIEKGEDIADVGLIFAKTANQFGENIEVDLVDDGRNIPVTNDNFEVYKQMYIEYTTDTSIRSKFDAFKEGFMKINPQDIFYSLSPDELNVIL